MSNFCPICLNKHTNNTKVLQTLRGMEVACAVCGTFQLSLECYEDYLDPQSSQGRKLSQTCRARLSHKIRKTNRTDASTAPFITSDFIERFIKNGCEGPTPPEQAINIIKFVGDEVSKSGEPVRDLPEAFYAIVGAPNPNFAATLIKELVESRFLTGIDTSTVDGTDFIEINLTMQGWEKYIAEKRGNISGNYGFLAMEFDNDSLDTFIHESVKPNIKEKLGFDLFNMRDVARSGIIDNIMREQIRDAAFIIAELTHDNNGAYWEAGYAEGLGKPVIYICEKSKFDLVKTHFDVNHCTTVMWSKENAEEFKKELIATLRRSLNLFPRG